jgi:hypothetical protein
MTARLAELHLMPKVVLRFGLPNVDSPIPAAMLRDLLASNDDLPLAARALRPLQQTGQSDCDFRKLEPAVARLARLLAPDDNLRPRPPADVASHGND